MLIEGEKWACEACVRGHRVSNCQHYDRPLTHINKKGRPVSQCPHCRGLRKARSSHVKCECGNKGKDKATGMEQKCCGCGGGQRCTCALKKDHLDTVLETEVPSLSRSRSHNDRKPRLAATHSDSSMIHFANGHHKPVHRNNHAGHDRGMPYRIPGRQRPHSIHGGHSFAQRSTDSLPLSTTPDFTSGYFPFQEDRMVRSEHGSPGMMPVRCGGLGDLPQLDLSYGNSITSSPMPDDFGQSFNPFDPYMSTPDEQPPPSALSVEPVDWNTFGLQLDNNLSNNDFPQPPSFASFDQGPTSHPGLTTAESSSGDVSEVDEFMSMASPLPVAGSPYGNMGDGSPFYNMSTDSLHSMHSMTPPNMLSTSAMNNLSMEAFMPPPTSSASPVPFDDFRSTTPLDQPPYSPMNFQDAPKLVHSGLLAEARQPSPPIRPTSDPLWASSYPGEDPSFNVTSGVPMKHEPVWTN